MTTPSLKQVDSAPAAGTIWRRPSEARDLPIGTLIWSKTPEGIEFQRQTLVPSRLEYQMSLNGWDAHTGRSADGGYDAMKWRDCETGKTETGHCGLVVQRYSLPDNVEFPEPAPIYSFTFKNNTVVDFRDPRATKAAQPWVIPTGAAVCAMCDSPCHVSTSLDLYTASDDKDYPICQGCVDKWPGDDNEVDRLILRRAELDDKAIAALTQKHDERAQDERARKVAVLSESLRQKVEPRFPSEGRSDRVLTQPVKRFP
jgi:hypothetical protein